MARVFLIAAGGTGGHLFPGLAVADVLRARDPSVQVVFVGTPRGLEGRLVPAAGYGLELLPILPLNAVGWWRALLGLLALPRAFVRAFALLRRLRPEGVLGVGGYAGGPIVLLASVLRVRTVILEPNARPGFTNRTLLPFVGRAACAYAETRLLFGRKAVLTGNPVRAEFARIERPEHRPPLVLLAFGGSQGSRRLNRALVDALPLLPGAQGLRIVHQTGESERAEIAAAYAARGREAEVLAFLDDMPARFAAADLVLSRSGATTCAELAAAGRASVLVPFAQAADDHQRQNARAMQAAGASRMIEEKDLSGPVLARVVRELLEAPERLLAMERAALRMARPDAAERVADLLEGVA
ncbi:MAG TPA: undecaprenyldiphospho-muramoylpentapeptide beta-N-acetylglucosaminyltransferase [Vicinamibacteria bacterium]